MAARPLAGARLAAAGLLFLALASVAAAGLFFGTAAGLLLLAIASVVAEGFLFGATGSRKKNCSGILQQVAEGRLSCTSHRPLKPNKIHTLQ